MYVCIYVETPTYENDIPEGTHSNHSIDLHIENEHLTALPKKHATKERSGDETLRRPTFHHFPMEL